MTHDQQVAPRADMTVHEHQLKQVLYATLRFLRENNNVNAKLKIDLATAEHTVDQHSNLLNRVADSIAKLYGPGKPPALSEGSEIEVALKMDKLHPFWPVWESVWCHDSKNSNEAAIAAWQKFVCHGESMITAL